MAASEPPYDAVLFDFDGVLADTEPVHCACWAEAVRPLGIHLDWEIYRGIGIGASDRDLAEFMSRQSGRRLTADDVLARHPEKQRRFTSRVAVDPPIPLSILEFIKSLRDYKLAVVTSSFRSEIDPVLERAGIRRCFEALVSGDSVASLKPSPEPYLTAAKLLEARSPLVVEDSDAGMASARAAGFEAVRVSGPHEVPSEVQRLLDLRGV
jgi:HAD superfamily hydrolase (TIGR01509 family)